MRERGIRSAEVPVPAATVTLAAVSKPADLRVDRVTIEHLANIAGAVEDRRPDIEISREPFAEKDEKR